MRFNAAVAATFQEPSPSPRQEPGGSLDASTGLLSSGGHFRWYSAHSHGFVIFSFHVSAGGCSSAAIPLHRDGFFTFGYAEVFVALWRLRVSASLPPYRADEPLACVRLDDLRPLSVGTSAVRRPFRLPLTSQPPWDRCLTSGANHHDWVASVFG